MKKKYKYLAAIFFSVSLFVAAFVLKNSFALSTNWYTDYTYTTNNTNLTITLTKYNGSDSVITIPAAASIGNKTYSVIVEGNATKNNALFSGNTKITKVTFENGVKAGSTLDYLFYGCSNLTSITFNNFNTSNTTSMTGMFQGCSKISSLDLRSFNTKKVTKMDHMFHSCSALKTLNMSSFKSDKLESIYYMFRSISLNKIYLGNFNFLYSVNDAKSAYPFGRGTWKRLEDGKRYAAVDIAYDSATKDISGTYVKESNIIEDMFINYNVTYQIGGIKKIDEIEFSNNNKFKLEGNRVYVTNLNKTSTADYTVPGYVKMLFKDIVTDALGNKYNLRLTIDNIHLYDLNGDAQGVNFDHQIFQYSSSGMSMASYNYEKGTENEIYKDSPSKFDVTIEVVDNNGVAQEGSYVFSARDLDIASARDKNSTTYPYNANAGYGTYSEGINLLEGYDNSSYDTYKHSYIAKSGNRVFGYHVDEATEFTEFTIKVNSTKFKYTWTGEGCATSVLSSYHPQFVDVTKQDSKGNNLAGANLELYSGDSLITSWTSTTEANRLFLNAGYYTLKEKTAPDNYVKSSDISFYVDVNGKIVIDNESVTGITMKNTGKPVRVIVNYIDETNNEQLDKITDNKNYNDSYTSSARTFNGYVLTRKPEQETVTLTQDETVLNYYYAKLSAGVLEKHIDVANNEILYNKTHTGNVNDDYNIPSKTFDGYDLMTDRLPNNSQGKMKEELTEVIYYYQKRASINVKYIDKNTNEPIIEDIKIDGHVNDDYETVQKDFPGYEFVSSEGPKEGKLAATNDDVIYYYQRVVYVTTEVNGEGGTITGDEIVNYTEDSTADNIVIEASKGYFIKNITINGENMKVTNDSKMILSNFINMIENKHIIVEFEALTPVPKTDMNTILPYIGIASFILGIITIYLGKRKSWQIN